MVVTLLGLLVLAAWAVFVWAAVRWPDVLATPVTVESFRGVNVFVDGDRVNVLGREYRVWRRDILRQVVWIRR